MALHPPTDGFVGRLGRRAGPPLLLLALVAVLLAPVAGKRWEHPTPADLATYVGAGRAFADRVDPRTPGVVDARVEVETGGGWIYPLAWLPPFAGLGALPFATAARAWLALQLAAVGALVLAAWWPLRTRPWRGALAVAVALVHALPAVSHGVHQGNAAPIEAALLTLGLTLALAARPGAGGVVTGLAATLKIGPAPLLAVAAWASGHPARALLLGAVPVALMAAVEVTAPDPFAFLRAARLLAPRADEDPSLVPLLRDLHDAGLLPGVPLAWAGVAAAVALPTLAVLRRRLASPATVALAWLAWILLLPRVQVYGWALALAPLAWAWSRPLPAVVGVTVAVACAQTGAVYGPWWTALATWATLLATLARSHPDRRPR